MRIQDIKSDERIAVHLAAADRREALDAMARAFVAADPTLERSMVFESLMARESIATTGIGDGVAVPHARLPGLSETQLVVATCPRGVEFQSLDGQPVRILVGVLSPADMPREGIRALSDVARCLKDPQVRADLIQAGTPAAVVEALAHADEQAPAACA